MPWPAVDFDASDKIKLVCTWNSATVSGSISGPLPFVLLIFSTLKHCSTF